MSATYMHIGIPITNRKPNMTYNEGAKFWVSNVDDYDYKIEYLKFEEGTPFPEEIHRNPHVAYKVDDLEKYIADADSVICGPMAANDKGDRLAFVWKDGAILELYQEARVSKPQKSKCKKTSSNLLVFFLAVVLLNYTRSVLMGWLYVYQKAYFLADGIFGRSKSNMCFKMP